MTTLALAVGIALAFVLYLILCAVILQAVVTDCPVCGKKALYPVPDFSPDEFSHVPLSLFKCEDCGAFGEYEDLTRDREEEKTADASATTR